MLKVMTIVGTRPELVKMSRVIAEFDLHTDHVLVHTGQNYDYGLNQVFFDGLGIRKPDHFLEAVGENAVQTIARVIEKSDEVMEKEKPDAVMLYGDTNSCLSVISAKRRKIPVFHMEAGNRCFDQRVPEELTSRDKLVEVAKANGIALKQTFEREGKYLTHKAGRYGHAKQYRRMRKVIKRQGTIVGRLSREIARKANTLSEAVQEALMQPLGRANRIQEPPYEFGTKVGIATTARQNFTVGARSFPSNPFDGHTLAEQIERATILMQDVAIAPHTVCVDRGYRLKKEDRLPIRTLLPDMKHLMTEEERKLASRRQAIEPIIGHLKSDHRLDRCYLKGQTGDAIHAVLCAAAYNIKWLMRMILQKGIKPFLFLFFALELRALFENFKQIAARFQTKPINHHLRLA